jgi:Bacterial protein of unknown function (DUF839)
LRGKRLLILALGCLVLGGTGAIAMAAPGSTQGPSSSQPAYQVPLVPGGSTKSILTTGDSVGGYRMAGIPDGLGAFDNRDGTFTLLSNHELPNTVGVPRAHGAKGAFVSRWVIRKSDLSVVSGRDQIQTLNVWDAGTSNWTPASGDAPPNQLNRLCSADLAKISAYFNRKADKGYAGRIFTDGEETSGGRPWGHVVDTGQSYELTPWLGNMAFENVVTNPDTGNATTTMELDDSTPGQVYVHVGHKTNSGNEVQRAGLANGKLFGIRVPGVPQDEVAKTDWEVGDAFKFDVADVSAHAGVAGTGPGTLEGDTAAAGVTNWQRPEDGSWDPKHPSDFYFVTTSNFGPNSAGTLDGHTRLWRLRFKDPADPTKGGKLTLLVNGPIGTPDASGGTQSASSPGPQMLDNITVDDRGRVIMLEDVGGQAYRGGVWVYDTHKGSLKEVAIADPAVFTPGAPGFVTKDEEASGVIPAPFLGKGVFLLDEQVHLANSDPELVEGGQYMALTVPPGKRHDKKHHRH